MLLGRVEVIVGCGRGIHSSVKSCEDPVSKVVHLRNELGSVPAIDDDHTSKHPTSLVHQSAMCDKIRVSRALTFTFLTVGAVTVITLLLDIVLVTVIAVAAARISAKVIL